MDRIKYNYETAQAFVSVGFDVATPEEVQKEFVEIPALIKLEKIMRGWYVDSVKNAHIHEETYNRLKASRGSQSGATREAYKNKEYFIIQLQTVDFIIDELAEAGLLKEFRGF